MTGLLQSASQDQILRRKRVQGKFIFLVELTTNSIGTCTVATPISCQILYTVSIFKENAFWRFHASPTRAFKVLATRALRRVAGRGIKWKPCLVRRDFVFFCKMPSNLPGPSFYTIHKCCKCGGYLHGICG